MARPARDPWRSNRAARGGGPWGQAKTWALAPLVLLVGRYSAFGVVFETAEPVIERCMLMATDPGDLVLDPTCGSGTTAAVAERWGRRWITIDASAIPVRSNYSIGLQTVVVADGYPGSEGVGSAAQPRRRGGSPRWRSRSAPKAHLKSTDVGAV